MYLMYIDESGDTATIQEKGSRFLVLTGCIIDEKDKKDIEQQFRNIKYKYYQDPDIEIKSNYLRYANPDITKIDSPIKLHDRGRYDSLEKDIASFLSGIKTTLISIVIEKPSFWERYPSQNPYDTAYIFLLERFQTFLQYNHKTNGICIIDPREGTVEKKYIDKKLDITHNQLRWQPDGFWKQCPNIIERILFSNSNLTVGIQICDLYCYPVFHVFKYNKNIDEYWRFKDITYPKLYYHTRILESSINKIGPKIDGTGLKFFPEETKKSFKFFQ